MPFVTWSKSPVAKNEGLAHKLQIHNLTHQVLDRMFVPSTHSPHMQPVPPITSFFCSSVPDGAIKITFTNSTGTIFLLLYQQLLVLKLFRPGGLGLGQLVLLHHVLACYICDVKYGKGGHTTWKVGRITLVILCERKNEENTHY